MTYKEYQKDLIKRQKEHLKNVQKLQSRNWRPCMHDSCPSCIGTGIRADGSACIHMIACSCPKCNPSYSTGNPISFPYQIDLMVTNSTFLKIDESFNGTISNAQNS